MTKALVFSGGGSKGSYEIGVWKALNKLHMKFDIVTGASIGAINGALYVQNDYFLAKRLWKTLTTKDFFDYDSNGSNLEYKELFKQVIKNGGMSFDKATNRMRKVISEKKVRNSKIDFGLVTVSLTKKAPKMLKKEEIPYGKLIDYISASCICYPFISSKDIDGERYIDGGFYDGLPLNLAVDMGATEIVAVNLNSIGINRPIKNKKVKLTTINFKDNKIFNLSFTREYAIKNMKLGYNDTMKKFNKLDGNKYTFKLGELDKNYKLLEVNYLSLIKDILLSNRSFLEIFNIGKYNKLFNNIRGNKSIKKEMNETIEYLGEIFNVDVEKVYSINHFNKILVKKINELSYIKINKNLAGKFLISYIYNTYKNNETKKIKKELYNIALLFPKEFLAALYLICLTKKYDLTLKADLLYEDFIKLFNKNR